MKKISILISLLAILFSCSSPVKKEEVENNPFNTFISKWN